MTDNVYSAPSLAPVPITQERALTAAQLAYSSACGFDGPHSLKMPFGQKKAVTAVTMPMAAEPIEAHSNHFRLVSTVMAASAMAI